MSFTRVNPGGWVTNDVISDTQINTLDTDHANAVDKRTTGLQIDSRSVTRNTPFPPVALTPSDFSITGVQAITTVDTVSTLHWPIKPPNGSTLTSVVVQMTGAAGHAAMPTTKPALSLVKYTRAGVASTISGPTTDGTSSTGTYQADHQISLTGLTEVIDNSTYKYVAVITTEGSGAGQNALSGAKYTDVWWIATVTKIDED